MKRSSIFSFVYQLLTAEICIWFAGTPNYTRTVVVCLCCACLLALKLLFSIQFTDRMTEGFASKKQSWTKCIPTAIALCGSLALLYFEGAAAFPLCCLLITELSVYVFKGRFIIISIVLCALLSGALILLLRPDAVWFGVAAFAYLSAIFIYSLFARLDRMDEQLLTRSNEIKELKLRAQQQRQAARALEDAARVEERNRLAARIHDDVGHGVSGSILLLDGALRTLDIDADEAKAAIETAADNLRRSVDDIRMALKDERSDGTKSGLARIKAELSRFETDYPSLSTHIATEGDLSQLRPELWACVYDNMLEALTNTLKHTTADRFELSVRQRDKLITVEFSDNGGGRTDKTVGRRAQKNRSLDANRSVQENATTDEIRSTQGDTISDANRSARGNATADAQQGGMGLINMEERCALCGGKFFLNRGKDGFHIVMTFPERRTV